MKENGANAPYSGRDSTVIGQADIYSALLDIAGLYGTYSWRGMGTSPFSPTHPGFAIGSFGEMVGNGADIRMCEGDFQQFSKVYTDAYDSATIQHFKRARSVSDMILRHNIDVLHS